MQISFRRNRLTKDQIFARAMIENGIQHGDPTPWGLYKESAGYTPREVRRTFATYLRSLAEDSFVPEANRTEMHARAKRLDEEAATLPEPKKRTLSEAVRHLFFRGQRV